MTGKLKLLRLQKQTDQYYVTIAKQLQVGKWNC